MKEAMELDRDDIKALLKGTTPPYVMMDGLTELDLGYYTGGFSDKWTWTLDDTNVSNNELLCLYLEIKTYWKNRNL